MPDLEESFDDEIGFDDLLEVGELDGAIEGILREDLDEGTLGAEAEAANVVDGDSVF